MSFLGATPAPASSQCGGYDTDGDGTNDSLDPNPKNPCDEKDDEDDDPNETKSNNDNGGGGGGTYWGGSGPPSFNWHAPDDIFPLLTGPWSHLIPLILGGGTSRPTHEPTLPEEKPKKNEECCDDDKDDPIFNPTFDDVNSGYPATEALTPPKEGSDNCYSYAMNKARGKKQPGDGNVYDKDNNDEITCEKLRSEVSKDGGVVASRHGSCPKGHHKIHVRIAESEKNQHIPEKFDFYKQDFHFLRQDQDCSWSQFLNDGTKWDKRKTDSDDKEITDPEKANHDYSDTKGMNYNKNCGYMCVPN